MAGRPPPPASPGPGFTRWPWWRRWFGRRSERAAAGYLRGLRWRVVAANVSDPAGEIDLLALDGPTLVVVEVRSTAGEDWERTAASVDNAKQRRITDATVRFLARRKLLGRVDVRFDVLVLTWPEAAREPVVRHFRHAFEAAGRFQFWS